MEEECLFLCSAEGMYGPSPRMRGDRLDSSRHSRPVDHIHFRADAPVMWDCRGIRKEVAVSGTPPRTMKLSSRAAGRSREATAPPLTLAEEAPL